MSRLSLKNEMPINEMAIAQLGGVQAMLEALALYPDNALHRHQHASATTLRIISLSPRGILQWPEEQSRSVQSGCGQEGGDADQSQP